jgi:hypothetical protein
VLALHYPRRAPYRWRGVDVEPLLASPSVVRRPASLWRGAGRLWKLHRRHPVDVVHAFWLSDAALLAALAAVRGRWPVVATAMGQDALPGNRYLAILPLRRMTVVAASARAAAALCDGGRSVDGVVPWGVSDPGPLPLLSWEERDIDLLGAGALVPVKDYGTFLQVIAVLARRGLRCRAEIFGDGPDRASLQELAERLDISGHVAFRGLRPRDEVLAAMARTRVLLHPATYEGFGLVFAEALARGACVASRPVGAAADGPRWRVAEGVEGLATAAASWLESAPAPARVLPFPAGAAARAYLDLYEPERRR